MSASIYKYDDIVYKEVYVRNKIEKSPKRWEYLINEKILEIGEKEDGSLLKYTVPYFGAADCPPNEYNTRCSSLVLSFQYMKIPTLYNQLHLLKISDFVYIFNELEKIIGLYNSYGIVHKDLNSKNIFYDKETKEVVLNDWGEGRFEDKKEDIGYWKPIIGRELIFKYFFEQNDFKSVIKYMKKTKLGQDYNGFKKTDNLFYFYSKNLKDRIYQRSKSNYKPEFFIKKLDDLYVKVIVEEMYNINVFKKYVNNHIFISQNIKKFFDINTL
jgi:serine/threonine protein kinase